MRRPSFQSIAVLRRSSNVVPKAAWACSVAQLDLLMVRLSQSSQLFGSAFRQAVRDVDVDVAELLAGCDVGREGGQLVVPDVVEESGFPCLSI